jgi:hypothetical protein
MTKKIARFRIHDDGSKMTRLDSESETNNEHEFIAKISGDESEKEQNKQPEPEASETPIQRFKRASDARHGIGTMRRLDPEMGQPETVAETDSPFQKARDKATAQPKGTHGRRTPMERFKDASAARHGRCNGKLGGGTLMKRLISFLFLLTVCSVAPASIFGQAGSPFFETAYNTNPTVTATTAPTFSITSPYSGAATTVTLSDSTSGATIDYCQDTTNTCTPTTVGTSVSVTSTGYIRAYAVASGHSASMVVSWQGTIASGPQFMTGSFQDSGAGHNSTQTLAVTCSGGEFMTIQAFDAAASVTGIGVTATNSNTVTQDGTTYTTGGGAIGHFHIAHCAAGSTTLTVTSTGYAYGNPDIIVSRYTGLTNQALDVAGTWGAETSATPTCSITPSASGELLVGQVEAFTDAYNDTLSSISSGFTLRSPNPTGYAALDANPFLDDTSSSSGVNTLSLTSSAGSFPYVCGLAAYN